MKLSFKMKVRLSVIIVFFFIIAFIIHEDHAGVVLKNFKSRHAQLPSKDLHESKESSTKVTLHKFPIKDKLKNQKKSTNNEINREVQNESINNNSTYNNNKSVVQTISDKQLNSSVVYLSESVMQTISDKLLNSSVVYLSESEIIPNISRTNLSSLSIPKDSLLQELNNDSSHTRRKMARNLLTSLETKMSDATNSSIIKSIVNESSVPQQHFNLDDEATFVLDNQSAVLSNISNVNDSNSTHFNSTKKEVLIEEDSNSQTRNTNDMLDDQQNNTVEVKDLIQKFENRSANSIKHNSIDNNSVQLNDSDKENVFDNLNRSIISLKETADKSSENLIFSNTSHKAEVTVVDNIKIKSVNETGEVPKDIETLLSQQDKIIPITNIINESIGIVDSEIELSNEINSNTTAMGLESFVSAGLDFLANSEVAKNAATAMEIFNLSDSSLTDHIIDDPDLHSVIDVVLPSMSTENDENQIVVTTDNKTSLNNNVKLTTKNDPNLALININKMNESFVKIENKLANSSNEIITSTELVLDLLSTDSSIVKKCPTPGICVFWFMARNACTQDNQCTGSKICCRVRCSKQCIDV